VNDDPNHAQDTDETQHSIFQYLNVNTQEGCKPQEDVTYENDSDNEPMPDLLDMKNTLTED
jgi:hypothetical protein